MKFSRRQPRRDANDRPAGLRLALPPGGARAGGRYHRQRRIALNLKDGGSITLRPNAVDSADAGRQLLFWGEARDFEFHLPPANIAPADVVQSKLSLTGYYERYSSLPNSAYRGGNAFISPAAFSSDVSPSETRRSGPFCRARAAGVDLRTLAPALAGFAPRP